MTSVYKVVMDGSGILYGACGIKDIAYSQTRVVRRNDEAISGARQDLTKTSFKTSMILSLKPSRW
jgi:hypothetical protein